MGSAKEILVDVCDAERVGVFRVGVVAGYLGDDVGVICYLGVAAGVGEGSVSDGAWPQTPPKGIIPFGNPHLFVEVVADSGDNLVGAVAQEGFDHDGRLVVEEVVPAFFGDEFGDDNRYQVMFVAVFHLVDVL